MVELVVDRSVPAGEVRVAVDRVEPQVGAASLAAGGPVGDLTNTRAFQVESPPAPVATLVEYRPDGRGRRLALGVGAITIGRAADNDLVVDDPRVSRHHVRLQARRGMLVLTDLDSANGSRVNGKAISEVALGAGDRIEIGATVFTIEAVTAG